MTSLRFILGDQLSHSLSALADIDKADDVVLMMEVAQEAGHIPHHKQKIAFLFAAMRHFAQELQATGVHVDYVRLDDPANTGSFGTELQRAVQRHRPQRVVMTEPGEWRVLEAMQDWKETLDVPLIIKEDTRFISSIAEFGRWAADRKSLRMEYFYREMRRKTGYLMDGDEPEGGQWNFDHDNRKALGAGITVPAPKRFVPDTMTREVLALVGARFGNHFGDLEPFGWAVTRDGALEALGYFVTNCLGGYGDFQDAMKTGEDFLFHSVLSPYINCGLLLPREACEAAIAAYRKGKAPLNAVEGFVRQIIGWREYVRGIYWTRMPGYAASNALAATRPLPSFYWTGETEMHCLRDCIGTTRRHAYAHHIQRLMVTGNFALLAGIAPAEIEEWYLCVYADAYEWVELPNVHGMVMFADGGLLASKPYAASGAYINRMSDYCGTCRYDPALKAGPGACPFNYLYWNFLIGAEPRLGRNPRMAMPYRTLAKMSPERRAEIVADAAIFLDGL